MFQYLIIEDRETIIHVCLICVDHFGVIDILSLIKQCYKTRDTAKVSYCSRSTRRVQFYSKLIRHSHTVENIPALANHSFDPC